MHVVYSSIRPDHTPPADLQQGQPDDEVLLRYRGYQTACDKYRNEITAIQKYMPGWMPKFGN